MTFLEKLQTTITANNSLLSIGLDPDMNKIPTHLRSDDDPLFSFNKAIIDATHELVCAYKPQIAHYEKLGPKGLQSLESTAKYIHENLPHLPLILDAKRGDIGSTAEEYAQSVFEYYKFDAVTVNPYLGRDAVEPFLKYGDKGIIILCRTSNPSAKDFQDLLINGEPLYIKVAEEVVEWNKMYGNCLMVVGATYPEEMGKVRAIAKDVFFLVPGIGAQGGDLKGVIQHGLRSDKSGLIIHSSRSILYASNGSDFAEKARDEATKLRDQINQYRK